MPNATDLLRQDHNKVKGLFREFEDTDDPKRRKAIAEEAFVELDIHAQIEEEIFYPAIRDQDDPGGDMEETMDEADEEHHVAKMIMKELRGMRSVDGKYAAKFTVLAENVKHHIGEEEAEIFTKAAEKGTQYLQDLGVEMEARKAELMTSYSQSAARRAKTTARKASSAVGKTGRSAAAKTRTASRTAKSAARKTVREASSRAKKATRR